MTNHQKKHRLKDLNWNTITNLFLIVIGAALGALFVAFLLSSCQKESSFTSTEKPVIESDHHLKPQGGYNLTKRVWTPELEMASRRGGNGKGKGSGKPPKDTTAQEPPTEPPTDTTGNEPPPPPTGQGVIYLDFDGHYTTGTAWNYAGPVTLSYSGMTEAEIQKVVDSVTVDYAEFGVVVTADSTIYHAANPYKRIRIVITESYEWYGRAGGVAYLGSFTWGDNTPAFVFSSLLGYSPKNITEAASHEGGHTLGLRHQSQYENGVKVNEYSTTGNTMGWAPIMGVGYYAPAEWIIGTNSVGQIQDDRQLIKNTLNQ